MAGRAFAGADTATVAVDSVPIYSRMSAASPVVAVLHKDDTVSINFSLASSDGEWCSIVRLGAGSESGNVPCDSLKRAAVASTVAPSNARTLAPMTLPLEIPRAFKVPRAPSNVRVYLVPVGGFRFVDVQYLLRYYQQRFGLTITPLTGHRAKCGGMERRPTTVARRL